MARFEEAAQEEVAIATTSRGHGRASARAPPVGRGRGGAPAAQAPPNPAR